MDEVFGYLPPTANPPSKQPLLTLLKQARAFGLGVLLATQNPVDLDYKALSNAGTWFLGRLQTERDKMRVLDGLEGASAASGKVFDRARVERFLSGVPSRVFLLNNVHEDAPVAFHTRWAMSYLRGPLTRGHIQKLMASRKAGPAPAKPTPLGQAPATPPPAPEAPKGRVKEARPALAPEVPQTFVLEGRPPLPDGDRLYRPALLSSVKLHFAKARPMVDEWREISVLSPLPSRSVPNDPWEKGTVYGADDAPETHRDPEEPARFGDLPGPAAEAKRYKTFQRLLKAWAYRSQSLTLWRCRELKLWSDAGESESDFGARVRHEVREKRDLAVAKLEKRYTPKVARLQDRLRRAMQKIEREKEQVSAQKQNTFISVGTTVLGALLGRKAVSVGTAGRAGTTLRRASKIKKEKEDVARAEADARKVAQDLEAMELEFQEETEAVRVKFEEGNFEIEAAPLRPRKSDIEVDPVQLAWTPWRVDGDGVAHPAFETRKA